MTFAIKPHENFSGKLNNGDGLCFVTKSGEVVGVRADVINGNNVTSKPLSTLTKGATIYRNFNHKFEKEIENNLPQRLIDTYLDITFTENYECIIEAHAESGVSSRAIISGEAAQNKELALSNIVSQLGKTSGFFKFSVRNTFGENIPFIPAKNLNSLRRELAQDMVIVPPEENDNIFVPTAPWDELDKSRIILPQRRKYLNCANALSKSLYKEIGIDAADAYELTPSDETELMRTKYCIRNELGLCPKIKKGEKALPLILVNNSKKLKVSFDCALCEMSITPYRGN
jgi:putative protease